MKLMDLLKEKKDNKIQVPGVGVYDYKSLKKNVEKKLKDLTKRNKQGAHSGISKNQFDLLSVMWNALKNYEEEKV